MCFLLENQHELRIIEVVIKYNKHSFIVKSKINQIVKYPVYRGTNQ